MNVKPRKTDDTPRVERWLFRSGVVIATGCAAFASFMISHRGRPRIYGMEHLAIFAQPNRSIRFAQADAPRKDDAPSDLRPIDPTPTGSIASPETSQAFQARDYEIIAGKANLVWLKRGDTILAVTIGQDVPGLGRIASIKMRNGAWRLLDADGKELLAEVENAERVRAPQTKRLMFDRE